MPVTNYYTVNGEIIAEHTTGSSRLDYLTDGLGSVIATIDQTLTIQSTARYKPFGAILASTGTQPRFGWNGTTGYRCTGCPHVDKYVEMRTYSTVEGAWSSVDPQWPSESAYGYVYGNPVLATDPTGSQIRQKGPKPDQRIKRRRPKPDTRLEPLPLAPPPPPPNDTAYGCLLKAGLVVGLTMLPTTLGSGMAPRPLRFPFPKLEPDEDKCDQMYKNYKAICAAAGPTKCTGHMMNEVEVTSRFNNRRACVDARIRFNLACDEPGGGAKSPNLCDHAAVICQGVQNMVNCFDQMMNLNSSEWSWTNLWAYENFCRTRKEQCPNTKDFP